MPLPSPNFETRREAPPRPTACQQFFPDEDSLTALYESGQRDLRAIAVAYANGTPVQRQALAAKHSSLFERYACFSRGFALAA